MNAAQITQHIARLPYQIKESEFLNQVAQICQAQGAKFTKRLNQGIEYSRYIITVKKDGEKEQAQCIF